MADTARSPVGYVLTHYPKLAQTFIANEIVALEAAGQPVRVFAMNHPEAGELSREGAKEKSAKTFYLKPQMAAALTSLIAVSLRHPVAMARVWAEAIASGAGSPARTARRLAHLAQAALVAREAKRERIERLHAHFGLAPATIAWLATRVAHAQGRKHAAFSFTIHGFHDFVDPAETGLGRKAAAAERVLCISDFTRSQLCLGTDADLWPRFVVARCGIDTHAFAYRDPPERAPSEPTRVMALGRLSAEKGFAVLVEAAARLRDAGTPIAVRIVGDGPMRNALESQVQKLGLDELVRFTGELPPPMVRRELAECDIFCMASFSEGLPISIMEAMAIGVPVVTTWIAGIPELARDGDTALTVPPADPEALADAIARLASDHDLALRIARRARERVEQRHDLTRCGEAVARYLQESASQ